MTEHHSFTLDRRMLLRCAALIAGLGSGTNAANGSSLPASPPAQVMPRHEADLVAANTAFALALYAALRSEVEGNLLLSPYSISEALAMVYAGAKGETATQMADVLGFTLLQPDLHAAFGALNADLVARGNAGADSEPVQQGSVLVQQARGLRVANALWGEQTYPWRAAYTAQLAQYYGAGLHETDFVGAPEEARRQINAWVAEQTEDNIQDIVPPDKITSATRLVLANAIWFSGGWVDPFDPGATEDGEFSLLDGTTVTVPFMFQQAHYGYARGDGVQLVELGYAGTEFAFTILLPDAGRFAAVEAEMNADALDAAIGQLDVTEVLLYLPRFTFAFDVGLAALLRTMGMPDAFDAERADFSGMVEGPPPGGPLIIDEVLHKASIGVDEEGTLAAAATIVDSLPGAAPPGAPPPEIRIDRPFLFAIRDTITGTVLFFGRVLDPRG